MISIDLYLHAPPRAATTEHGNGDEEQSVQGKTVARGNGGAASGADRADEDNGKCVPGIVHASADEEQAAAAQGKSKDKQVMEREEKSRGLEGARALANAWSRLTSPLDIPFSRRRLSNMHPSTDA
jgi:hypothetical protein